MYPVDSEPDHLPPLSVHTSAAQEIWDRRQRDPTTERAREVLEHAARHLIRDQLHAARIFHPGAKDAVELLWAKLGELGVDQVHRQRIGRLSAGWLPRHVLTRARRDEVPELI